MLPMGRYVWRIHTAVVSISQEHVLAAMHGKCLEIQRGEANIRAFSSHVRDTSRGEIPAHCIWVTVMSTSRNACMLAWM